MAKVVYLTGAPAAGKSSTTKLLADRVSNLEIWEYGARLTTYVQARRENVSSQEDVRRLSAGVITMEDVRAVDEALLDFVAKHRGTRNVIIDSHPVTKERYGFRIIPFSLNRFSVLHPDEIWVFYTSPDVTLARIGANSGGRPIIDAEQARMHTALQRASLRLMECR
jgi:adenylate kinase